jgi:ABC-type Zn uptake system ZnuABC Zn-binding protein ZnuA
MKDKIIKAVAIATVTVISSALVAYLKNPENRLAVQKSAKKYQAKFQKTARKTKKQINSKLRDFQI